MDRQGNDNMTRFPYRKSTMGYPLCRFCGIEMQNKKRTFCSPRCLRDFFMQTDWQRVRMVIWERDGGVCMKCNTKLSKKNFHVDHIVPVSKGGAEWDLNNLELSCPQCNLRKGSKESSEVVVFD